jgi:hypothetical protein
VPHDYTHAAHVRWVVSALEWNKDLTINSATQVQPLRVGGTITLLQYNHDDIIDAYDGSGEAEPRQATRHRPRTRLEQGQGRQGEDLHGQEGRHADLHRRSKLGDSKRWKEIADLNNVRNPRSIKVGQVLRMPK